MTISRTERTNT